MFFGIIPHSLLSHHKQGYLYEYWPFYTFSQLIAKWFAICFLPFLTFHCFTWPCCCYCCSSSSWNILLRDLRKRFLRYTSCCFCCFSSNAVIILSLFFLQRECYEFERAFFTLRRFLLYTPSRCCLKLHLSRYPKSCGQNRRILYQHSTSFETAL